MAFAYKVKGRKIELLAQDLSGYYVTPKGNDAKVDGLKFEYTERAKFVDDSDVEITGTIEEDAIVDLPEYLAKALVYFIKCRLAEDSGEMEMKEYFMHQFQKMIDMHEENKTHGLSQAMVGPGWGIK
jgi:hypothetical protein